MRRREFLKSMTALTAVGAFSTPAVWSPAKAQSRNEVLLLVTENGPNNLDIHGVGTNRPGYEASWNCYDRLILPGLTLAIFSLAPIARMTRASVKRRHKCLCALVRPKIDGLRRLIRNCHFLSQSIGGQEALSSLVLGRPRTAAARHFGEPWRSEQLPLFPQHRTLVCGAISVVKGQQGLVQCSIYR